MEEFVTFFESNMRHSTHPKKREKLAATAISFTIFSKPFLSLGTKPQPRNSRQYGEKENAT